MLWLVMVAACGGKAATTTTTTSTTTPPANETGTTEPVAPPAPTPPADTNVCDQRSDAFGPYTLDEPQAAARYGRGAKKITDALTPTKDKAIEVCGIPASRAWLNSVTCAGGETPKQLGRRGSVGAGGRCESIIDKYGVECPEQTYEVFIDIYMCGPGESLM